MMLGQKQRAFAKDLGLLLTWGLYRIQETYPGAAFRMGEGYVADSINKPGEESPHRRDGGHFKRLAQDLMLDIDDEWITSSEHPAWEILHEFWSSLNPENKSGGGADANHFGRLDGGIV
jgi:hypothetical protein